MEKFKNPEIKEYPSEREIIEVYSKRKYAGRILKIIALEQPITIYKVARKLEEEIGTSKDLYPTTLRTIRELEKYYQVVLEDQPEKKGKNCYIAHMGLNSLISYDPIREELESGAKEEDLAIKIILKILKKYFEPIDILSRYGEARKEILSVIDIGIRTLGVSYLGHELFAHKPLEPLSALDAVCFQTLAGLPTTEEIGKILSENPKLKDNFKDQRVLIRLLLKRRKEKNERIEKILEVLSNG